MNGGEVLYCVGVMAIIERAAQEHANQRRQQSVMAARSEARVERIRDELEMALKDQARLAKQHRRVKTVYKLPMSRAQRSAQVRAWWTPERREAARIKAKQHAAERPERDRLWNERWEQRRMREKAALALEAREWEQAKERRAKAEAEVLAVRRQRMQAWLAEQPEYIRQLDALLRSIVPP